MSAENSQQVLYHSSQLKRPYFLMRNESSNAQLTRPESYSICGMSLPENSNDLAKFVCL